MKTSGKRRRARWKATMNNTHHSGKRRRSKVMRVEDTEKIVTRTVTCQSCDGCKV